MSADPQLSSFPEGFPVHSFAPGVWVEWRGQKLIAVPDKGSEACSGCVFAGSAERPVPKDCTAERNDRESYLCASDKAGMNFSNTVRIIPEDTYFKMRIKGEL